MRLSAFILAYREQILTEWVTFARSCCPANDTMGLAALRDHASEMLDAIAADLNTAQTESQQIDKSEGKSDADPSSAAPDTAAQSHGAARAKSGFDVEQMVAEFRALRASVVRLWVEIAGELTVDDIRDLMRFNEAIDQALAESTARHAEDLGHSKEMFLAMVGHDLRTPLSAIITSAQVMAKASASPETVLKAAAVISNSGRRMNALLDDILDFTRVRLGGGIAVARSEIDIGEVCRQIVDELNILHPRRVRFTATGDLRGTWDRARMSQVLSNLIGNALQHGSAATPVHVDLRGGPEDVELAVKNSGPVIPPDQLGRIFDPMHRLDADNPVAPRSNLGLGLYIAEGIVTAHGGTISVESSEEKGTIFTIKLSRHARGGS